MSSDGRRTAVGLLRCHMESDQEGARALLDEVGLEAGGTIRRVERNERGQIEKVLEVRSSRGPGGSH